MRRAFRSPLKCWLLLAVAGIAVFGHVCALPAHAHGTTATESHHHADVGESPDSDTAEDAVHVASCDIVLTATLTLAAPVLTIAQYPAPHTYTVRSAVAAVAAPAVAALGPPLFLRHAALLI